MALSEVEVLLLPLMGKDLGQSLPGLKNPIPAVHTLWKRWFSPENSKSGERPMSYDNPVGYVYFFSTEVTVFSVVCA